VEFFTVWIFPRAIATATALVSLPRLRSWVELESTEKAEYMEQCDEEKAAWSSMTRASVEGMFILLCPTAAYVISPNFLPSGLTQKGDGNAAIAYQL